MSEVTPEQTKGEVEGLGPEELQAQIAQLQERLEHVSSSKERTLNESKTYKSKYRDAMSKLEEYENAKLEQEGKWQEINAKLQDQLREREKKMEDLRIATMKKDIINNVYKYGSDVRNVDALLAIPKYSEVISVDDDGNVAEESIKNIVERARKEDSWLFKSSNPKMVDGRPDSFTKQEVTNINQMSKEQRNAALKAAIAQLK